MIKNGKPAEFRSDFHGNHPVVVKVTYDHGWPKIALVNEDGTPYNVKMMNMDQWWAIHRWLVTDDSEPRQKEIDKYNEADNYYTQLAGMVLTLLATMYGHGEGLSMTDVNNVIDSLKTASSFLPPTDPRG